MPKAYSSDLRRRVIRFVDQGHSRHAAARRFDVSASFVIKLMQTYKRTGRIGAIRRGGVRHDSLSRHIETLADWIGTSPSITLGEMSRRLEEELGVSSTESGLSKLLRRCGYTYKKIHAGQRSGAWTAQAAAP